MKSKSFEESLASIQEYIDSLPKVPDPTPEEIKEREERARSKREREDRERLLKFALGERTGWPEKYMEAVENPPTGKQWESAFVEARTCLRGNGILVLFGKRGTGKTRMAAELALLAGESVYRTAMRFFLEVRATFKRDSVRSELDLIDELVKTKLLILDEIQERGETPFEDRLLTHVIDARYASMKPSIIIANLSKRDLAESLGASIVDRARENGKSIEFNWESYRNMKP